MKLYTRWQNSAGERVRIALNLKGLDYDYVSVGSLGAQAYAAINPQGLMPALELDGQVFTQSAAILDLLETRFPERQLLPADPVRRAHAIAFGAIIASEMHALTVNRVRKYLAGHGIDEAGLAQWVQHWQGEGFAALEALLARRAQDWDFCYGEVPGWADLHLAPQVAAARRLGVVLERFPLVVAITERCESLPAFIAARPEAQPDFPKNAG
ncbi:Glutathione S-transferase [Devosia sp. LC5]|uniref:maleylacetoacetate isomerase n=1 Tax=Devosia sp. LC5 TaxID=1502724 RepID=UPI0004E2FDD6|nr:maleylacetoacetate isomerase [Devosia sp. LC5]KFC62894.1 Glutathione S-transferase [Devosia sp. LC5]